MWNVMALTHSWVICFMHGKETAFSLYLHIKLPYALTSNPNVLVILSPSTSVVCNT